MNKDVLLIICAVLTTASIAVALITFEKQNKLTKSLEEEKYGRLVAEESSQKSSAKLATIENQLKSADEKMAKLKDILDQEKGVNEDLKNQYDRLSVTKTDLESKLKTTMEEQAAIAAQAALASTQEESPTPVAESAVEDGAK